jgi:hypothetical protein
MALGFFQWQVSVLEISHQFLAKNLGAKKYTFINQSLLNFSISHFLASFYIFCFSKNHGWIR